MIIFLLFWVSKGLRIGHLNCCSLLSHKDEILELIMLSKLYVLTLSETWLDDTIPDSKIMWLLMIEIDMVEVWKLYYQIMFAPRSLRWPSLSGESFILTVKGLYFCVVLIDHHPNWTSIIILLQNMGMLFNVQRNCYFLEILIPIHCHQNSLSVVC